MSFQVDFQLWQGGVLAQLIRNINPLGMIWTPILDRVVFGINFVQSRKLKEVSYYQYTSRFINALYEGYDGRKYKNLRVTGASLGGGLAILTGNSIFVLIIFCVPFDSFSTFLLCIIYG